MGGKFKIVKLSIPDKGRIRFNNVNGQTLYVEATSTDMKGPTDDLLGLRGRHAGLMAPHQRPPHVHKAQWKLSNKITGLVESLKVC